jgi:hypothetical protein
VKQALKELAWHHRLEEREPAIGFASRLANLNARPLGRFLRDMLIFPRDLDRGYEDAIKDVSVLGNASFPALLKYSPRRVDDHFWQVGSQKLKRLTVNRTYFRVCPECIQDDIGRFDGPKSARPWLRLSWMLSHYRMCNAHQRLLVSLQPFRKPFEPFDFSITIADSWSYIQKALPAKPLTRSLFQDWFTRRLDGIVDQNNWLDDVELYAAAEFCEELGLSALYPSKVRSTDLQPEDWIVAANEGYHLASEGSVSVENLLKDLTAREKRSKGTWGPRDTLGRAYGLLQKHEKNPAYVKFRDLFATFTIENIPIKPGVTVLGHKVDVRKVHTIHTSALASGTHALTMRKLFEREGFAHDQDNLVDHRTTVEAEQIQEIVEKLKTALSAPQVERITGIPKLHLRAFISLGYLSTITGSEKRSYAKHRISPDVIEPFMTKLFANAVEVDNPMPRQVPISTARLMATARLEQVLTFIMEDKLKWKGRPSGDRNYNTLLLDADEITQLVRGDEEKSGLTKIELLDFIPGIAREAVNPLIDAGELEVVEEFSPAARRLVPVISRKSADEFKRKYVSLGELCQDTGLHHKQVRSSLRKAGVSEALDREKYRCFFYLRNAVGGKTAYRHS